MYLPESFECLHDQYLADTNNIAKISMDRLLSHLKTKHQLTSCLGQALLENAS